MQASVTDVEIISIITDRFCTALFSALELTQCALAAGDFEWVTVAFLIKLFNIHQSGVLTALFGCYLDGAT